MTQLSARGALLQNGACRTYDDCHCQSPAHPSPQGLQPVRSAPEGPLGKDCGRRATKTVLLCRSHAFQMPFLPYAARM